MRNITSWGEKTGKSSSVAFRASSLKQASSFELFDVDFRLLASCSRLLAVACWLPPLACPLSYAGCRLLASIFHLLASTCWLPSPAYWLLPVGFHIYLTCPFSLSPAGCRLLAVACCRSMLRFGRMIMFGISNFDCGETSENNCWYFETLKIIACWLPPAGFLLPPTGCCLLASTSI